MTRDTSDPDHERARTRVPMRDVSHTNPYTNESMGSVFEHGVTVVADGGQREAVDAASDGGRPADDESDEATTETAEADAADETDADVDEDRSNAQMKDVAHEAPTGGHGNRMFERVGNTDDVTDEIDEE